MGYDVYLSGSISFTKGEAAQIEPAELLGKLKQAEYSGFTEYFRDTVLDGLLVLTVDDSTRWDDFDIDIVEAAADAARLGYEASGSVCYDGDDPDHFGYLEMEGGACRHFVGCRTFNLERSVDLAEAHTAYLVASEPKGVYVFPRKVVYDETAALGPGDVAFSSYEDAQRYASGLTERKKAQKTS